MKRHFVSRWFLIVVVVLARAGLSQDPHWRLENVYEDLVQRGMDLEPMNHRQDARATFHTRSERANGWTSVQFPREIDVLLQAETPARWGIIPPDNTLNARGDARHARTTQAAIMAAISTSSRADLSILQAAVSNTGPGDVARLPAGCFEMTGAIVIPEGISLVGAGITQTILYRPVPRPKDTQPSFIRVIGGNTQKKSRISGITLVNVAYAGDKTEDTAIALTNCDGFRVDNCYFQGFGFCAVMVRGNSRGVVDHCIFMDNYKPAIENLGYGVGVENDDQWHEDMNLGTADAIFVEDCTFVGCRHAVTSNAGAHYVFRHNLVEEDVVSHPVDAHGPGYGSKRGTRCIEVYGNTVRNPRHAPGTGAVGQRPTDVAILVRGGGGVIFDNMFQGYARPIVSVLEFGTPEELRGPYPWQDQVHDLWAWNNRTESGPCLPEVNGYDKSREYIVLNRDYFAKSKPGYVPFTYPHPLTQQ